MENQTFTLKTGDIIITETRYPFIEHFGVVVYSGHLVNVFHCTPNGNVRVDSFADFLIGRQFKSIRRTGARKVDIMHRYDEVKDRPYDLDEFNCTHFANYVTGN